MPHIRVMNWNIEQLSWNKIRINGMADAIARTVVSQNIDILVLLEVKTDGVTEIMTTLSTALSNAAGGGNQYSGWFLSYMTGGEYYGFVIRDLNAIRPLRVANDPDRTAGNPLSNLKKNRFDTWPNNNFGMTAYPVTPPHMRPTVPLTDLYATRDAGGRSSRGQKRARFAGQPLSLGGFAMGRGSRLPAMALFMIHTVAGNYLVPIICCHYAAVRGGRNRLAQGQFSQLKYLHIAQLFNDGVPLGGAHSGYLNVDGNATNVQEILFTGDYNMDFLKNLAGGNNIQQANRRAYDALTPTQQHGGSAAPPANSAPPSMPAPVMPYNHPFFPGPLMVNVNNQSLRAAATTQGTHLVRYDARVNPPNTNALKDACFDNFIFGGTQLAATVVINFGVGNVDAGDVVDVPANIVQNGAAAMAPQDIDLSGVAAHYAVMGTKNAVAAPNLRGAHGVAPALTVNDRLIGARMVSDHLPVVIDFNIP